MESRWKKEGYVVSENVRWPYVGVKDYIKVGFTPDLAPPAPPATNNGAAWSLLSGSKVTGQNKKNSMLNIVYINTYIYTQWHLHNIVSQHFKTWHMLENTDEMYLQLLFFIEL